jgi:biopolymer transport protein ExbD
VPSSSTSTLRLRRSGHEVRIETMPLIDVVFLLLTFFIYAVAVMDRVDALPMQTAAVPGAGRSEVPPAATISLDAGGGVFLDRTPIAVDELIEELGRRLREQPETVVYLAAARDGDRDRLPRFLELYGRLAEAGIPVSLVSLEGAGGAAGSGGSGG